MIGRLLALLLIAAPADARDVKVTWTNPTAEADTLCAFPGPDEVQRPLSEVRLTLVRIPHGDTLALPPISIVGRESMRDSVLLTIADSVYYAEILAKAVDEAGNASCIVAHALNVGQPDTSAAVLARVEAQFWRGIVWSAGTYLRTEWPETVDFDSTTGGTYYSVSFRGSLEVPAGGARLYVMHDDAARLYVDGVWVTTQSSCTDLENVQAWDLSAGVRAIKVDYVTCGEPAACRLEWDAGGVRQVVPNNRWR